MQLSCTIAGSNRRWNFTVDGPTMRCMEPLAGFAAVVALALLVPGPDTFVVLRTALAHGPHAGTWAAAGAATGNVVWGAGSVLGVAGLLAASGTAFAALKLAGAAYLVVLGVQALLAAARGDALAPPAGAAAAPAGAAFRRGLASDLLNVKVGLFWTALVPQFVAPGGPPLLPVAMVAVMAGMAFGWLTAYAHLAARVGGALRRPAGGRAVNGTVGAVLVALGARLGLAGA
jgi:threonine/homoserine/homoserine lactone efflux protein